MRLIKSPEACGVVESARAEAAWESVEGAVLTIRSMDDDGIRCVVHSPFLGGAWIHSNEETLRRIHRYHPHISSELGAELLRIVQIRIRSQARETDRSQRKKITWMNSWREN